MAESDMYCSLDLEADINGDGDAEAKLRERRPTNTNKDELLGFMEETRAVRRRWILKQSPTISDILTRYPRLADMPQAVCVFGICASCGRENYVKATVMV